MMGENASLTALRSRKGRFRLLLFLCVSIIFLAGNGCKKSPKPISAEEKAYPRKVLKILRTCDIQASRRLKAANLALLSSAYPRMHCPELDKHCPDLVNYGGVLIGRLMPGDLHHRDKMLANAILQECSSCRLDGRETCFTCRGTGVCARCKGSGKVSRQGFDSPDPGSSGEESSQNISAMERCPIKCTVCKGTGHMAKSCRKCGGKKYLLNRKKLRIVYIEQYKIVEAIVKSQAGL